MTNERTAETVRAAAQAAYEADPHRFPGPSNVDGLKGYHAALAAALDVEKMARVAHADDVAHGRAGVSWEDLDGDAVDWYLSNARAIRATILGSDQ